MRCCHLYRAREGFGASAPVAGWQGGATPGVPEPEESFRFARETLEQLIYA